MKNFLNSDIFLIINALLVFTVLFFISRFLKERGKGQFRDDLWQGPQKKSAQRVERTVDQLAYDGADKDTDSGAKEKPRYRQPNFKGAPHEVLGLALDYTLEQVREAHRHWIKCYHPDHVNHLGVEYTEQANKRAMQLNQAKAFCLKHARK